MSDDLRDLVDALADLYGAEGRPGGDEAAAALRAHRDAPVREVATATAIDGTIRGLCRGAGALTAARLADRAWDALPWHHSGLADGRIPEEIARSMITCEILGPRGPLKCETCRVGLFAQIAGVDYAIRTHSAEETFIMLAGRGEWRMPPDAWRALGPGEASHHPSMVAHQSRSGADGFLAAWRWTGEIGLESYAYRGEVPD